MVLTVASTLSFDTVIHESQLGVSRSLTEGVQPFILDSQILSVHAISETVKTVARFGPGNANPKLKLGENEKLGFQLLFRTEALVWPAISH
jgi:hypothetical protein